MKVQINAPKRWFGPYQLAELLCWWAKQVPDEYGIYRKPEWVDTFGEWLAHGSIKPDPKPGDPPQELDNRTDTWINRLLVWIDKKKRRKIYVRIDSWDTWNADITLAYVILPILKKLKLEKEGSPYVSDEDVPEHLRRPSEDSEELHHERWSWVLDQMIFAFENILDDSWEEQFISGTTDFRKKVVTWDKDKLPLLYEYVAGPNHTYKVDKEGMGQYQARIDNGFRLFGKYYQSLWS